jgi:hypothetical protein|tara:strand:- start:58 stop:312 length:255 start_codon:yes stop_codon:yes gene_type:complete
MMGPLTKIKTMREVAHDGDMLAVVPIDGDSFVLDPHDCAKAWSDERRRRQTTNRTITTLWGTCDATGLPVEILWADVMEVRRAN